MGVNAPDPPVRGFFIHPVIISRFLIASPARLSAMWVLGSVADGQASSPLWIAQRNLGMLCGREFADRTENERFFRFGHIFRRRS
jgi:hypothetical protein